MEQRGGTQPGKKQIMQKRIVFVKRNKQGQERQEKPEERCYLGIFLLKMKEFALKYAGKQKQELQVFITWFKPGEMRRL